MGGEADSAVRPPPKPPEPPPLSCPCPFFLVPLFLPMGRGREIGRAPSGERLTRLLSSVVVAQT